MDWSRLLERLYLWRRRLGIRLRRNRDGNRVPVEDTRLGSCVSAYVIDRSGVQTGEHRGETAVAHAVGRVRARDRRIGVGAPADAALGDRFSGGAEDLPANGDVSGHHLTDRHGDNLKGCRFCCGRGGRLRIGNGNRLRSDHNRRRSLRLRNDRRGSRLFSDYRFGCAGAATFTFLKFRTITVRNAYTKARFDPEAESGLIHLIGRIVETLHIIRANHFARDNEASEMEHEPRSGGRSLRHVQGRVRPLSVNRLVIESAVGVAESKVERQRCPIAQRDARQSVEIGAAG